MMNNRWLLCAGMMLFVSGNAVIATGKQQPMFSSTFSINFNWDDLELELTSAEELLAQQIYQSQKPIVEKLEARILAILAEIKGAIEARSSNEVDADPVEAIVEKYINDREMRLFGCEIVTQWCNSFCECWRNEEYNMESCDKALARAIMLHVKEMIALHGHIVKDLLQIMDDIDGLDSTDDEAVE